jgi:hypothetical protein
MWYSDDLTHAIDEEINGRGSFPLHEWRNAAARVTPRWRTLPEQGSIDTTFQAQGKLMLCDALR